MNNANSWTEDRIRHFEEWSGYTIERKPHVIAEVNQDFGRLKTGMAAGFLEIVSNAQLIKLLTYANQHELQITIRNGGLSQSGQSLAPKGSIIASVQRLNNIEKINEGIYRVGPGCTWNELVSKTQEENRLPLVIPFNPNLTIGGTISVGGIGAGTFRFGFCSSHIVGLTIIRGDGIEEHCHPGNPLFTACLGTQGQIGVITAIDIKCPIVKPNLRTFHLFYQNRQTWLDEIQKIKRAEKAFALEAFTTATALGTLFDNQQRIQIPHTKWQYLIQVSYEYEYNAPLKEDIDVQQYQELIHIDDRSQLEFVKRYQIRFDMMKKTGAWDLHHPWYESLFPLKNINDALNFLQSQVHFTFGGFHHVIPIKKDNLPYFCMTPDENDIMMLTLLPMGFNANDISTALSILQKCDSHFKMLNRKRYLSGFIADTSYEYWKDHYGNKFHELLAVKNEYNKNEVLQSSLHESIGEKHKLELSL